MKNPMFKDNVEDKEIKFLLPEDKDIVVNKSASISVKEDRYGR